MWLRDRLNSSKIYSNSDLNLVFIAIIIHTTREMRDNAVSRVTKVIIVLGSWVYWVVAVIEEILCSNTGTKIYASSLIGLCMNFSQELWIQNRQTQYLSFLQLGNHFPLMKQKLVRHKLTKWYKILTTKHRLIVYCIDILTRLEWSIHILSN